jgi:capsular polysaccharide biosynthesis protein
MASTSSTTGYRPPRSWLRVGKYLLPVGVTSTAWLPSAAPRMQVPIAQLAQQHPDRVRYQSVGQPETVDQFAFACHAAGKREVRTLAQQSFPSPFVAQLKGAMSYGRQCCVIGPDHKAVRETGFYLDGDVQTSKIPVSRLSLRYWRKRWASDVSSRLILPARQRISGRVAVLNARYSHNYFHWLIEILPRLMSLRQAGITADFYLVDCLSPLQQTALAALGIGRHQLIQPHCKLLLEADELVLPSFPSPQCLRDFGRAMLAGLGVDAPVTSPRRIFISRRKTGTRTLDNEPQLEQLLQAHGFETHAMEDYSLAKQARLIHEAEIVVATHGAGLANLVFARPRTRVIEIVPAGRFNYACYPKRTRFFNLHHQLVFAECPGRRQVLHVALDDVAAALAETEATSPHTAAA